MRDSAKPPRILYRPGEPLPEDAPVVLVVDDDPPVRHMLGQALQLYGYKTDVAANGAEAVKLYRRKHFDIVLLDVQMPGLDGPKTLAKLRAFDPEVLCCFMTGWPGDYAGGALLEIGCAGVISKPFTLTELCGLLSQALSTREGNKEIDN
jgi:CheY-like chemotaxis protein